MKVLLFIIIAWACGCALSGTAEVEPDGSPGPALSAVKFDQHSWPYFLQHLPVIDSPIVNYYGQAVKEQYKHTGIIPYDVGTRDLQQCADALMRLRAEYLFSEKRYDEIGFYFTGGQYFPWKDYRKGLRPVVRGNSVNFVKGARADSSHGSLRKYLDIVYTYAGTISLAKELKKANGFAVGTVVIHPGSPGHCFIIIDEKTGEKGEKLFRLAEGYTPAQSIYELRNPFSSDKTPWQSLDAGAIRTASYIFTSYELKKFE